MKLKQIIFQKENINNEYITYEKALKPKLVFANDDLKKLFEDIRVCLKT